MNLNKVDANFPTTVGQPQPKQHPSSSLTGPGAHEAASSSSIRHGVARAVPAQTPASHLRMLGVLGLSLNARIMAHRRHSMDKMAEQWQTTYRNNAVKLHQLPFLRENVLSQFGSEGGADAICALRSALNRCTELDGSGDTVSDSIDAVAQALNALTETDYRTLFDANGRSGRRQLTDQEVYIFAQILDFQGGNPDATLYVDLCRRYTQLGVKSRQRDKQSKAQRTLVEKIGHQMSELESNLHAHPAILHGLRTKNSEREAESKTRAERFEEAHANIEEVRDVATAFRTDSLQGVLNLTLSLATNQKSIATPPYVGLSKQAVEALAVTACDLDAAVTRVRRLFAQDDYISAGNLVYEQSKVLLGLAKNVRNLIKDCSNRFIRAGTRDGFADFVEDTHMLYMIMNQIDNMLDGFSHLIKNRGELFGEAIFSHHVGQSARDRTNPALEPPCVLLAKANQLFESVSRTAAEPVGTWWPNLQRLRAVLVDMQEEASSDDLVLSYVAYTHSHGTELVNHRKNLLTFQQSCEGWLRRQQKDKRVAPKNSVQQEQPTPYQAAESLEIMHLGVVVGRKVIPWRTHLGYTAATAKIRREFDRGTYVSAEASAAKHCAKHTPGDHDGTIEAYIDDAWEHHRMKKLAITRPRFSDPNRVVTVVDDADTWLVYAADTDTIVSFRNRARYGE